MQLLKKISRITVLSLLCNTIVPQMAIAQTSLHTKKILATEPIPENRLAQDQLKLNADYDPSVKYAVNCTIYLINYSLLGVSIKVLSTYKVNACDPDLFRSTTAASAKAQLNTYQSIDRIIPVGPHIQLMDRNTSTVSKPYLSIGLLNFSEVGSAHLGVKELFTNLSSWRKWLGKVTTYNPINMAENTDYVWLPGSKVYTLTTDKGQVFVMSHFLPSGVGTAVKGIENTAENLGQYLNLPSGWRYEVKTLTKVLTVKRQQEVGHTTLRIIDEYSNAYIGIDSKLE